MSGCRSPEAIVEVWLPCIQLTFLMGSFPFYRRLPFQRTQKSECASVRNFTLTGVAWWSRTKQLDRKSTLQFAQFGLLCSLNSSTCNTILIPANQATHCVNWQTINLLVDSKAFTFNRPSIGSIFKRKCNLPVHRFEYIVATSPDFPQWKARSYDL